MSTLLLMDSVSFRNSCSRLTGLDRLISTYIIFSTPSNNQSHLVSSIRLQFCQKFLLCLYLHNFANINKTIKIAFLNLTTTLGKSNFFKIFMMMSSWIKDWPYHTYRGGHIRRSSLSGKVFFMQKKRIFTPSLLYFNGAIDLSQ